MRSSLSDQSVFGPPDRAKAFLRCDYCRVIFNVTGDGSCPLCGSGETIPMSVHEDRVRALLDKNAALKIGAYRVVDAPLGARVGVWPARYPLPIDNSDRIPAD